MARAYPVDFRERLLTAHRAGTPVGEIAALLQVSVRTILRWKRQVRLEGHLQPKPRSGRPRAIAPADEAALRAQVLAHPDATISEHCQVWQSEQGRAIGRATMCRALRRLDLPRKKRA